MPSKIEWLNADDLIGETWNVLTGCDHKSAGCDHCWAARMATRQIGMGNKNYRGSVKGGKWTGNIKLIPDALDKPRHWRKPRRIFVQSMGDLFHENVPFKFIDGVCMTMAICHQHTFMILTKRPKRMAKYFNRETGAYFPFKFPLPNVHLYTSIEDQDTADERVEWLLKTPAVVHGLSIEPMLGPVDLWGAIEGRTVMGVCPTCYNSIGCTCDIPWRGIDHVIVGGESGPGARPMHPDWVRSVRDQCVEAGVKFFFKQWGAWRPPFEGEDFNTAYGRAQKTPAFLVDVDDGTVHCLYKRNDDARTPEECRAKAMIRVGKRATGRELDGRTWDEMPGQEE